MTPSTCGSYPTTSLSGSARPSSSPSETLLRVGTCLCVRATSSVLPDSSTSMRETHRNLTGWSAAGRRVSGLPLKVFQVPLDVAGALEPLEDQRVLQTADVVLHHL